MEKEQIQNLIKDLVEKITLNTPQITVNEEKGNNLWFSVVVNEPHHFTSKEGEALQALNHLVRRIIEAKNPIQANIHPTERKKELSFSIDINDFQKRKVEAVRAVAHMMGERARYFKSNIEVDPMSSFERRIVHEFLSEIPDLKTESIGFGSSRRVVIKYIGTI
jgi:predicted RNA-binding protein Jag